VPAHRDGLIAAGYGRGFSILLGAAHGAAMIGILAALLLWGLAVHGATLVLAGGFALMMVLGTAL
jgi:hypothetical protein